MIVYTKNTNTLCLDWSDEMNHKVISKKHSGELVVFEVETHKKLTVSIENSVDSGYHSFGTRWWENPNCPFSYSYLDLDELYPSEYFDSHGHPSLSDAENLYDYMQSIFFQITGRNFRSIFEIGAGGGHITRVFQNHRLKLKTLEGTINGVKKLQSMGIPKRKIIHSDLKFLKSGRKHLNQKYDITMCTEVAEHVEPWFASKVVEVCTDKSKFVWFSAAKGEAPPHYHHMNEIGIYAWDNIFAQFGFNHYVKLDGRFERADRLYISKQFFDS